MDGCLLSFYASVTVLDLEFECWKRSREREMRKKSIKDSEASPIDLNRKRRRKYQKKCPDYKQCCVDTCTVAIEKSIKFGRKVRDKINSIGIYLSRSSTLHMRRGDSSHKISSFISLWSMKLMSASTSKDLYPNSNFPRNCCVASHNHRNNLPPIESFFPPKTKWRPPSPS